MVLYRAIIRRSYGWVDNATQVISIRKTIEHVLPDPSELKNVFSIKIG